MSPHVLALAGVGILAATGTALARAHLRSATPPVNGTVAQAPGKLDLILSQGVDPAGC